MTPTTAYREPAEEPVYSSIESAIEAIRRGEFLVVSDEEDRENEGDLVIAADHADAKAINFMITEGRGLVCISITPEHADRLDLHPMVPHNGDHHGTAFTVSVDAGPEYGVTTGISAHDRAETIRVMLDPAAPSTALRRPGHLFPLVARSGGVRERQGHTEAAVDLARLAGLSPAGVIVEIVNADGTMARQPELAVFARKHGIKFITIRALQEYMEQAALTSTSEVTEDEYALA